MMRSTSTAAARSPYSHRRVRRLPYETTIDRPRGHSVDPHRYGCGVGLRHEVVSVIVVLGVMPRHNPLSHQRYPTQMCGKVTTRTVPADNAPTVVRLASQP